MKTNLLLAAVAGAALVLGASACGGSSPAASSGSQSTGSQLTAQSSSSGGGGSPTAAPAAKTAPTAVKTAPAAARVAPTAAAKSSASSGAAVAPLEKVAMPSGTTFDPSKPVKIGDVVELPKTGIVLQVTGVKTADFDAQRDVLLVDLVLGNKGKETLSVSSVMMMDAVTSDWHWYGLTLADLFQVSAKIAALKVASFDGDVPVNEARKGTAILPVPKDAKGLGFAFTPSTFAVNMMDPTVYVGLGLKGDFPFPIISEDVQPFKVGTVYKPGEAVKAPKRGVALQVNGARERTQSLPQIEIKVDEKFVMVDVTARVFGSAADLTGNELRLMDSSGKYLGGSDGVSNLLFQADNTQGYFSWHRRGMWAYKGPRDAKGLKLVFSPATGEKIEFDLGTVAQSSSTGPAVAAPKLADASVLPEELKSFPMPQGFKVVDGSVHRRASGGKFQSADAQLFGEMSISDLSAFYKAQLAKDWETEQEDVGAATIDNIYFHRTDDGKTFYINAERTDIGTEIQIMLEQN
jgi:hypothetical protein